MDIKLELKKYNETKADIAKYNHQIKGLEDLLTKEKQEEIYDKTEEIEAYQLKAVSLSDMPRSHTNFFHSTTESAVLLKPPIAITNVGIREEIKILKSRKYPLERKIDLIDNVLLICLNVKEKFIIKTLYLEGYNWFETTTKFNKEFDPKSEETISKIKSEAFRKMNNILKMSA